MNTVEIITLTTGIATFLSALIMLFSLLEMIRQRKNSYKPELVFSNFNFDLEINNLKEFRKDINAQFYNIGLGAAKDIKIEWDFDINSTIKFIRNHDVKEKNIVNYNNDNKNLNIESEIINCVITKLDLIKNIDHLLPVSVDKNPYLVPIPSTYIYLISVVLNLGTPKWLLDDKKFTFPTLSLKCSYRDIGNNKRIEKYKFQFHACSFESDKEKNLNAVKGYVEILK